MKKNHIQRKLNDLPKSLLAIIFSEVLRNNTINKIEKAEKYERITKEQQ